MREPFASYILKDMCVQYRIDEESGAVGLEMIPSGWEGRRRPKNQKIDPIVQIMIRGDNFPFGFACGHTMRGSGSLSRFRYIDQKVIREKGQTKIITLFGSSDGQELAHQMTHDHGENGVEIQTTYSNNGSNTVTLDMLSSFSFGGITPFIDNDAPESVLLHRLRSKWANEARLDSRSIEDSTNSAPHGETHRIKI